LFSAALGIGDGTSGEWGFLVKACEGKFDACCEVTTQVGEIGFCAERDLGEGGPKEEGGSDVFVDGVEEEGDEENELEESGGGGESEEEIGEAKHEEEGEGEGDEDGDSLEEEHPAGAVADGLYVGDP